ncbi:putative phage abortive infection protein, partial [Testudinibacter aquarius]
VYRVLKLIDESKLEDKRNFSAIMRAIIPNNFLWLISINCLHTQKTEQSNYFGEFKKLWSKHAMLEHIKLFYDFSPEEFEDITDDEFAELDIEKSNYKEYHINILIHFKEQFGQEVFGDGFNLKYFENEFKKQEAPFR